MSIWGENPPRNEWQPTTCYECEGSHFCTLEQYIAHAEDTHGFQPWGFDFCMKRYGDDPCEIERRFATPEDARISS